MYTVVNRSNVDKNTIFETLEINNVIATINDWYQNSDRIDMYDYYQRYLIVIIAEIKFEYFINLLKNNLGSNYSSQKRIPIKQ